MYDAPKVINLFGLEAYHCRFPQLSIMAEQSCFVKMLRYDITIPVRKQIDDDFNIFERTVIKLVDVGINSAEMISDTICIPRELANFILSRLTELGIIDMNANLTETGRNYLNSRNSSDGLEMVPAVILSLAETGEYLPVVLFAEDISYEETQYNGKKLIMFMGSAGNRVSIEAELIKNSNDSERRSARPKQTELRKIIDKSNNILLGMNRAPLTYYRDRMIDCSSPTEVYVYVKAAVQNGNVDNIICSEGILINNDIIGRVINKSYEFKSRLISSAATTGQDEILPQQRILRYEEILKKPLKALNVQSNLDEQHDNSVIIAENVRELYSKLEHAFNYYLKENPPSNGVISMFRSQNMIDNQAVLFNYLLQMGADMHRCNLYAISSMNSSSLDTYQNTGIPTLRVVVPLAIAQAHENPSSTIRDMIYKYPEFLELFAELNEYAATFRHGENTSVQISRAKYQSILDTVKDMIKIILPDIDFGRNESAPQKNISISNRKVRAISACTNDLGATKFYSLSPFVQTELLKTSSDKSDYELPIVSDIIISFCKIIENMLITRLQNMTGTLSYDKSKALNIIEECTGKTCPLGLSSVADKYVKNAAIGQHSTIGGLTLAYILNENEGIVKELLENGYHEYISTLAGYRMHGNSVSLSLSSAKIKQLRQMLYQLIDFLGG